MSAPRRAGVWRPGRRTRRTATGSGATPATPRPRVWPPSRTTRRAATGSGATHEPGPRVTPGRFPQIGVLAWLLARGGGRRAGTEPMTLFLTLGRHRRLFRGWLHFAATLMPFGTLPRRDTELVILRVAHLRGCDYERVQHERIGREAGLTADDLARVASGPAADGWTTHQRALLTAVDEFVRERDVSDTTWTALREHLEERACLELLLVAGHYDMLAGTITALRLQPERPR